MLGLAAVKDVLRVSPSVRQFSPRRAGSSVKHWKKTVNEKGKISKKKGENKSKLLIQISIEGAFYTILFYHHQFRQAASMNITP